MTMMTRPFTAFDRWLVALDTLSRLLVMALMLSAVFFLTALAAWMT